MQVGIKSKGKDPRFGDINSYIYELVKHCHDAFWIRSADYDDQVLLAQLMKLSGAENAKAYMNHQKIGLRLWCLKIG